MAYGRVTYEKGKEAACIPFEPLLCYVCDQPIIDLNAARLISGEKDRIWRHDSCAPGSPKWMKSPVSKNSEFRTYFEEVPEMSPQTKEKKQQKLEAFKARMASNGMTPTQKSYLGRVKYNVYMDNVSKKSSRLDWSVTSSELGVHVMTAIDVGYVLLTTPHYEVPQKVAANTIVLMLDDYFKSQKKSAAKDTPPPVATTLIKPKAKPKAKAKAKKKGTKK